MAEISQDCHSKSCKIWGTMPDDFSKLLIFWLFKEKVNFLMFMLCCTWITIVMSGITPLSTLGGVSIVCFFKM